MKKFISISIGSRSMDMAKPCLGMEVERRNHCASAGKGGEIGRRRLRAMCTDLYIYCFYDSLMT